MGKNAFKMPRKTNTNVTISQNKSILDVEFGMNKTK